MSRSLFRVHYITESGEETHTEVYAERAIDAEIEVQCTCSSGDDDGMITILEVEEL